jgi:hypothetical protein
LLDLIGHSASITPNQTHTECASLQLIFFHLCHKKEKRKKKEKKKKKEKSTQNVFSFPPGFLCNEFRSFVKNKKTKKPTQNG